MFCYLRINWFENIDLTWHRCGVCMCVSASVCVWERCRRNLKDMQRKTVTLGHDTAEMEDKLQLLKDKMSQEKVERRWGHVMQSNSQKPNTWPNPNLENHLLRHELGQSWQRPHSNVDMSIENNADLHFCRGQSGSFICFCCTFWTCRLSCVHRYFTLCPWKSVQSNLIIYLLPN